MKWETKQGRVAGRCVRYVVLAAGLSGAGAALPQATAAAQRPADGAASDTLYGRSGKLRARFVTGAIASVLPRPGG